MRLSKSSAYDSRTMRTPSQSVRQMGVWAATAVDTGEAISLGIFLTPAGMAKSLGSPILLAAVWVGMAIMTLAGALCFTELAVRNPHDGSQLHQHGTQLLQLDSPRPGYHAAFDPRQPGGVVVSAHAGISDLECIHG